MARPRGDEAGPSARERIAAAFWGMLAEGGYDSITVRALAARAGVNHNTIYRHFESIDQMAEELFSEAVILDMPRLVIGGRAGEVAGSPEFADGLAKAVLFARSGSTRLQVILRGRIEAAWLAAAGVDADELTDDERIDLDIIFGGIVAAMGDERIVGDAGALERIAARPLGRGMHATLAGLAQRR